MRLVTQFRVEKDAGSSGTTIVQLRRMGIGERAVRRTVEADGRGGLRARVVAAHGPEHVQRGAAGW